MNELIKVLAIPFTLAIVALFGFSALFFMDGDIGHYARQILTSGSGGLIVLMIVFSKMSKGKGKR